MESLSRTQRRLIWIGCLIPFAGSIALMLWYWPGALPQDSSSGVWTALAQDFSRGVFYRPTFDAFGFGGTRYMPLFFILHGSLIRLSFDPIAAGLALTLLAIVLFDVGLLLTLRELGVDWALAVPLSLLPHAALSFQLLTLQVKGDFLAAALTLWGVWLGLRYERRRSGAWLAACALAFLAAFLTKFTSVTGAVVICGWLASRKNARAGVGLAAALVLLAAGSFGAINWASAGRVLSSFHAVATGGMRAGYASAAPLWFLLVAIQDPVFLIILVAVSVYAAVRIQRREWSFPVVYFVLAAATTLLIFTSPGTDTNHFLDLLGAAVLLLGDQLVRRPQQARLATAVPVVLAVLTAATWIPGMISIKSLIQQGGKPERRSVALLAQRLGPDAHDLLSENPIVPILLGERPRVLDPFSLRLLARRRAEVGADFAGRLSRREFGAVVLVDFSGADPKHLAGALRDCTASDGARCYGEVLFSPGFLHQLEQYYRLSFVERPFVVFVPRQGGLGPRERAPGS